jgi:hypothetical protein
LLHVDTLAICPTHGPQPHKRPTPCDQVSQEGDSIPFLTLDLSRHLWAETIGPNWCQKSSDPSCACIQTLKTTNHIRLVYICLERVQILVCVCSNPKNCKPHSLGLHLPFDHTLWVLSKMRQTTATKMALLREQRAPNELGNSIVPYRSWESSNSQHRLDLKEREKRQREQLTHPIQ